MDRGHSSSYLVLEKKQHTSEFCPRIFLEAATRVNYTHLSQLFNFLTYSMGTTQSRLLKNENIVVVVVQINLKKNAI